MADSRFEGLLDKRLVFIWVCFYSQLFSGLNHILFKIEAIDRSASFHG
jgi:hypothetical protein